MALEIVFSDVATEMLFTIGEFIEVKWSKRETYKFLDRVHKIIGLTATQPYMFKASRFDEKVRIGRISKQTSFYYEIHENELIILFFWDNRQEPFFTD